ncbi:unnamed protein product [Urochloa decumbens]|uniref:F-box domain-containing protein n=1 Tax=Urochloa decumbens TaxID=240449 RepID=A0ABC9AML9_9POAL
MSERSEAARSKRHAAAGGVDRLGALPDELLLDVLSFLPSPYAHLLQQDRVPIAKASPHCTISLKRLHIAQSRFLDEDVRPRISAPSLIFLLIVDCKGRVPFLESVPLLVEAFVRLQNCADSCKNGYEVGDCGDESCWGCSNCKYGESICVALQGLSSCTNLELTAETAAFIFRKDLMRCPVFSKLKTLLLNEWCITDNIGALICFLQHSPVLEKLALQFYDPEVHENLVVMKAGYDLWKQPLVLKDLTVEVKFHEGDERIHKVVDALASYGLPSEKIMIKQYPKIEAQFDDTWSSGSKFSVVSLNDYYISATLFVYMYKT